MVSVAASTSAETLWLNCSASTLMPSTYRELERQWEERMCFLPIRASSCQLRTVGLCRLSHGMANPRQCMPRTVFYALTWDFLDDLVQVHDTTQ